jgi:transcriptional antiterminator RfaH
MRWYVVHTKPRQESRAHVNLERQGYTCFCPTFTKKKLSKSGLESVQEPLFPRYLFIELDTSSQGRSWAPIRSTLGVSKLVTFGTEPASVNPALIEFLKQQQLSPGQKVLSPYTAGDRVVIATGAFQGVEAIYQMDDGESRAMVLIELLQKLTRLELPISELRLAS